MKGQESVIYVQLFGNKGNNSYFVILFQYSKNEWAHRNTVSLGRFLNESRIKLLRQVERQIRPLNAFLSFILPTAMYRRQSKNSESTGNYCNSHHPVIANSNDSHHIVPH